jgi:hypothetical protein
MNAVDKNLVSIFLEIGISYNSTTVVSLSCPNSQEHLDYLRGHTTQTFVLQMPVLPKSRSRARDNPDENEDGKPYIRLNGLPSRRA